MSDAEILGSETLIEGWLDVASVRLRLRGEETERKLVIHPCGATVLAYDPDRKVALVVREMRLGILWNDAEGIDEAISGVTEAGEDGEETARREAQEEAGLELAQVEFVGEVWMTPSSTTERVRLYLARYTEAQRTGDGGGLAEESEHVEVAEKPLAELWAAIGRDGPVDGKLFMLLHALRVRRPELFA